MGFPKSLIKSVSKLAPLASFIPGVGPVVAAGLSVAGGLVEGREAKKQAQRAGAAAQESAERQRELGLEAQRTIQQRAQDARDFTNRQVAQIEGQIQDAKEERDNAVQRLESARQQGDRQAEALYQRRLDDIDARLEESKANLADQQQKGADLLSKIREEATGLAEAGVEAEEAVKSGVREDIESSLEGVEAAGNITQQQLDELEQGESAAISALEEGFARAENEARRKAARDPERDDTSEQLTLGIAKAKARGKLVADLRKTRIDRLGQIQQGMLETSRAGGALAQGKLGTIPTGYKDLVNLATSFGNQELSRLDTFAERGEDLAETAFGRKQGAETDIVNRRIESAETGARDVNQQRRLGGQDIKNLQRDLQNAEESGDRKQADMVRQRLNLLTGGAAASGAEAQKFQQQSEQLRERASESQGRAFEEGIDFLKKDKGVTDRIKNIFKKRTPAKTPVEGPQGTDPRFRLGGDITKRFDQPATQTESKPQFSLGGDASRLFEQAGGGNLDIGIRRQNGQAGGRTDNLVRDPSGKVVGTTGGWKPEQEAAARRPFPNAPSFVQRNIATPSTEKQARIDAVLAARKKKKKSPFALGTR